MAITNIQQAMAAMGAPYGKTIPQLMKLAIRHWKEWRPKEAADLEAEGRLRHDTRKAAEKAHKEIQQLMEAEEEMNDWSDL